MFLVALPSSVTKITPGICTCICSMSTSKGVSNRRVNDGGIYIIASLTSRYISLSEPSEQLKTQTTFRSLTDSAGNNSTNYIQFEVGFPPVTDPHLCGKKKFK